MNEKKIKDSTEQKWINYSVSPRGTLAVITIIKDRSQGWESACEVIIILCGKTQTSNCKVWLCKWMEPEKETQRILLEAIGVFGRLFVACLWICVNFDHAVNSKEGHTWTSLEGQLIVSCAHVDTASVQVPRQGEGLGQEAGADEQGLRPPRREDTVSRSGLERAMAAGERQRGKGVAPGKLWAPGNHGLTQSCELWPLYITPSPRSEPSHLRVRPLLAPVLCLCAPETEGRMSVFLLLIHCVLQLCLGWVDCVRFQS